MADSKTREFRETKLFGIGFPGLGLLVGTALLFHFAGNSTFGYVKSHSLFAWVGAQWFSPLDDMAHGPFVVLASLFLVARAWRRHGAAPGPTRVVIGLTIAAALVHALGYVIQLPRVSFFGLLFLMLAVIEAAAGSRVRRASLGGVMLLLLALSWAFVDTWGVTLQLRLSVTAAVETLVNLFGAGYMRQGTVLVAPGSAAPLEVAAACAGLRSTAALLCVAVIVGEVREFRLRWRATLVASALAVVWIGNVVRVLGLVLLARVSPSEIDSWPHSVWGAAVFAIEVALVLALASRGRRTEVERITVETVLPQPRFRAVGIATWVSAGACVALAVVLRSLPTSAAQNFSPHPLPQSLAGRWMSVNAPLSALETSVMPKETLWERRIYFSPADPARQVLVTQVWAVGDRTSIHRPELCLAGMGWAVAGRAQAPLGDGDARATVLQLTRADGSRRGQMAYWFESGARHEATYSGMLWAWARGRLQRGGAGETWGYCAVQTLETGPTGRVEVTEVAPLVWRELNASDVSTPEKTRATAAAAQEGLKF